MSERQVRRARERRLERDAKGRGGRIRRVGLGAGAALGAGAILAPAAQADNFEVTKLADTNDGVCDADCSLREAVDEANGVSVIEPDLITFAAGLAGEIYLDGDYDQIVITEAMTIQGPGAETLEVDADGYDRIFYVGTTSPDAVTISGLTLEDGDSDEADGGALYASEGSGPLTIADAVIRDNYTDYGGFYQGGAISARNDSLTITGSTIHDNFAVSHGGAIYADTELEISDTTISGNETFDGDGGGIHLYDGSLSVTSSRITRNVAGYGGPIFGEGGDGGGIFVYETSTDALYGITLYDSVVARNIALKDGGGVYVEDGDEPVLIDGTTFEGNDAVESGGGVGVDNLYDDGSMTVTESAFTGNDALLYDGGGLWFSDPDAPVTVEGSTFDGNFAGYDGGGIEVGQLHDEGSLEITETTVAGNESLIDGGGVNIQQTEPGSSILIAEATVEGNETGESGAGIHLDIDSPTTIENSTISGNTAADRGGGVYVDEVNTLDDNTGELHIDSSTIAANAANGTPDADSTGVGGGIYRDNYGAGDVELSSTIVADSTAGGDIGENTYDDGSGDYGGEFVLGFSLVETPGTTTYTEDPVGSNIFGYDPELGALADNGGQTETHLPTLTSPAIDAGVANTLATDQRGDPRTVDQPDVADAAGSDGTDIGAVERALPPEPEPEPPAPPPPPPPPAQATASCQGAEVPRTDGTEGDDNLVGTSNPGAIFGLGGDDILNGIIGPDCLDGGGGDDILKGGGGTDVLAGGAGRDKLRGQGGRDELDGQSGRDKLHGGEGRDLLEGRGGRDKLRGGGGKDRLRGGGGPDKLNAVDEKRDRVNCGAGNDKAVTDPRDKVSANCEKVIEKA